METGTPVRVVESSARREGIKGHGLTIILRVKLLAFTVFLIGIGAVLYYLLDPPLGTAVLASLVGTAVALYVFAEYLFIAPVRALLAWYRDARERNFVDVVAAPLTTRDELGHLARELSASISGFWGAEERIRVLASHKSDTISLIEHQLRTPLTALRWSLESVAVPVDVKLALLRIEMNVRAIIEAARIEEGKFGFVFAEFDIVSLIEQIAGEFKPLAENKGIAFEIVPDQGLPKIVGDQDRLGIVLSNLIGNAVDYTPSGGRVSVRAVRDREGVVITIADTGIGIPEDELPLLFNKLYRGRNAQRLQPDGSGLGLFVTKNILEEHASDLVIRSKEREGTEVSFLLPLK